LPLAMPTTPGEPERSAGEIARTLAGDAATIEI
jgi:hypothetical protein